MMTLVIQVDGKVSTTVEVPAAPTHVVLRTPGIVSIITDGADQ